MSKTYKGQITNNVVELTLQDEQEFKTPTIVWSGTTNGEIDQVQGDIPADWKNGGGIKQLQIGSSCTSIGDNAFDSCSSLTGSLVIPDSVTSIGSHAFYICDGFTGDLVIPDSVTSIGTYAFFQCLGFSGTLTIGSGVTSIGNLAFMNCRNLTGDVVILDNVTSIGNLVFRDGLNLGDLYLDTPASSWIGTGALSNCGISNIYVNDVSALGYTAGAQTFQSGSVTIAEWTNYPNIP